MVTRREWGGVDAVFRPWRCRAGRPSWRQGALPVGLDQAVHCDRVMGSSASFRLRGSVQAEGAALVAFLMGPQGGLLSVLVEIGHLEPAGGTQPYSGVKKRLQERAITEVEDGIAGGHGRRDQGIQVQAAFLAA